MEKMGKITNLFRLNKVSEEKRQAEVRYNELMEAKKELDAAWEAFNEVTESSYIDIAILKLNLAKKRFEVLIEENKKSVPALLKVN